MSELSWKSRSGRYSRKMSNANSKGTSMGTAAVLNSRNDPFGSGNLALTVPRVWCTPTPNPN